MNSLIRILKPHPSSREWSLVPFPGNYIAGPSNGRTFILTIGFAIADEPDYTLVATVYAIPLFAEALGSAREESRNNVSVAISAKNRLSRAFKWGLILFFATQVGIGIPNLQTAVEPFLTVPAIGYAEKMHIQWGSIFDLLYFIRRETPDNAVILMKDDGRPEFDQYFLFPRHVVYGDADALLHDLQISYVLIDNGYPQFPVIGTKLMLDDTHGLFKLQR